MILATTYLDGALTGGESSFTADDADLDYAYAVLSAHTTAAELVAVTNVSGTTYTAAVVGAHSNNGEIILLEHVNLAPEWFGATGSGDDGAFDAMTAAINLSGGAITLAPNTTYAGLSAYTFTETVVVHGNGATLSADGTGNIFTVEGVRGSEIATDSDVFKGESRIECASIVGSLSPGDVILIYHQEDASPADISEGIYFGEQHIVAGTSGNYVLLEHGILHSGYTTANSARISKIDAIHTTMRDFTIEQTYTDDAGGVTVRWTLAPLIENVIVNECKNRAFNLSASFAPHVRHCTVSNSSRDGLGYGASIQAMYPRITDCFFVNCRHGITTGGAQAYDMNTWDLTIEGCHFSGSPALNAGPGIDTHATFSRVYISGCVVYGADAHDGTSGTLSAFTFEGGDITIDNCHVYNCANFCVLGGTDATTHEVGRVHIYNSIARDTEGGVVLNNVIADEVIVSGLRGDQASPQDSQLISIGADSTVYAWSFSDIHAHNMQLLKIGNGAVTPASLLIDGFSCDWDSAQATEDCIEMRNDAALSQTYANGSFNNGRFAYRLNDLQDLEKLEFINVEFNNSTTYSIDLDAGVDLLAFHNCTFNDPGATYIVVGGSSSPVDSLVVTGSRATESVTNLFHFTGTFNTFHHHGNFWNGNVSNVISTSTTAPLEVLGGDPVFGGVHRGSGAPTHAAAKGTLYTRTDGDFCSFLYVNTDGSTTWRAFA